MRTLLSNGINFLQGMKNPVDTRIIKKWYLNYNTFIIRCEIPVEFEYLGLPIG